MNPGYQIESFNYYCTGGGTYCKSPSAFLPGANLVEVAAFGMPGQTGGTPLALFVDCADLYMNNGVLTSDESFLTTTPNFGPSGRTVGQTGWAGIVGDPSESGTATMGIVNVMASESYQLLLYTGYYNGQYHYVNVPFTVNASVTGTNVDNNSTDHVVGGQGYAVSMKGNFLRQTWNPATQTWSLASVQSGTMSCTGGGSHANDLVQAGLLPPGGSYAEAELEAAIT